MRDPTPQLTFTAAQLAECDEEHDDAVLGCPVCFLYLLHSQPFVDVGVEAAQLAAGEGDAAARAMLEQFNHLRSVVVSLHLKRPDVPAGGLLS